MVNLRLLITIVRAIFATILSIAAFVCLIVISLPKEVTQQHELERKVVIKTDYDCLVEISKEENGIDNSESIALALKTCTDGISTGPFILGDLISYFEGVSDKMHLVLNSLFFAPFVGFLNLVIWSCIFLSFYYKFKSNGENRGSPRIIPWCIDCPPLAGILGTLFAIVSFFYGSDELDFDGFFPVFAVAALSTIMGGYASALNQLTWSIGRSRKRDEQQ